MAAERDDNSGVLGNLPRSRPGQRSTKRGTGSAARKPRAASSARSSTTNAKRSATAKPKRTTTTAAAPPPERQRRAPAARKQPPDPVGQAVQLAGKLATVGLKTATGIVKRLPRP